MKTITRLLCACMAAAAALAMTPSRSQAADLKTVDFRDGSKYVKAISEYTFRSVPEPTAPVYTDEFGISLSTWDGMDLIIYPVENKPDWNLYYSNDGAKLYAPSSIFSPIETEGFSYGKNELFIKADNFTPDEDELGDRVPSQEMLFKYGNGFCIFLSMGFENYVMFGVLDGGAFKEVWHGTILVNENPNEHDLTFHLPNGEGRFEINAGSKTLLKNNGVKADLMGAPDMFIYPANDFVKTIIPDGKQKKWLKEAVYSPRIITIEEMTAKGRFDHPGIITDRLEKSVAR